MRHEDEKTFDRRGTLALIACILLPTIAPASASSSRHYWSPCVSPTDIYGPKVRYGFGIPWRYVPPEPVTNWVHRAPKHMLHSRE